MPDNPGEHFITTIDGPTASGKSTVSGKVAKRLRFIHLNSGNLYRAVGVKASSQGIDLSDAASLAALARSIQFDFKLNEDGRTVVLVDGEDIEAQLQSREGGVYASMVARFPEVRTVLTEVQRAAGRNRSMVLEGRDAGNIVFPGARFKFYLEASLDERATRRFNQLFATGQLLATGQSGGEEGAVDASLQLEALKREIAERDVRDAAQSVVSPEAVRINTAGRSVEEVVGDIIEQIASGK
jgi:CMP/dCMP kinase